MNDIAKVFRDPRAMMESRRRNETRIAKFRRRMAERPWHPDAKKVWPDQIKRAEESIKLIDGFLTEAGLAVQRDGDVTVAIPSGKMKVEGK